MNIIYILEKWKLKPQEITCLEQFQATYHEQDHKQSLCFSKSHLWASSIRARDLHDFMKQSTSSGRPRWVPDAYLLKMIIMIMIIAIIWDEQMVRSQREPDERSVYGILSSVIMGQMEKRWEHQRSGKMRSRSLFISV